ncbi:MULTISPECIES: gliding motility lipoprotein GldH [Butyricimonas]|uniref:gliding motility lipoprotein GldH n=1 Tax=Butyricimonas TaxID=574697 RepID=UPI0007FB228E|nr:MULTISPECIES: gliding motility lipoprotein GldH [Butyricimonas]
MKKKLCIYTLFLLSCCMACNISPNPGIYKSIARETWDRDSNYKFEFNITQPGTYVVSTCVRHSTDYKQHNLSCHLTVSHPGLMTVKMNPDIILANENGEWLGQGLGGLKTIVHSSDQVLHLDSTGIYTVEISHRMKEKELKGIKNIGIKLSSYKINGEE